MGTQGPKKPNWLVLGAFGGSGEALSWGKKAKLPLGVAKPLLPTLAGACSCPSNRGLSKLFSADCYDSKGAFGRRVNFSRFDEAVLNLS